MSFPGAQESIIDERDAYMARTIRAAAQGTHFNGLKNDLPVTKWRFTIPDWHCVLLHCVLFHCPAYEDVRVTYTVHCH